jgi:lipopolysaccharide export system protein LptA
MNGSTVACLIQRLSCMGIGITLMAAPALKEQVLEEPAKGVQYAEVDEATGRRKSLFRGETAQSISNQELQVTGARLEIFTDDGKTNLIVVAPQCIYNTRIQSVASSGQLRVSTGEGQFSIEGEGFEWQQAGGHLVISNQVHAVLHKGLMDSMIVATQAVAASVSSNQFVDIYSGQFQFRTNVVVFRQDVRVEDPQGKLSCERLSATFTEPERRIKTVVAEENVIIEAGEVRATGEKAIYHLTNDLVELTGNPTWRIDKPAVEGRAEEIAIERKGRNFHASRGVRMTMPQGSLGQGGFLNLQGLAPTNAVPDKAQPVEVLADDFRFRADAVRTNFNLAILHGNVQLNDEQAKLRCKTLTISSAAQGGLTESAVAEGQVVVEQGRDRVTAEKAVYSAADGAVELTGKPTWIVRQLEGTAERVAFDVTNRTYRAARNVRMRLPPGAFGQTAWLLPKTGVTTNVLAAPAKAAEDHPTRPVELSSDEFEFKSAVNAGGRDLATYRGNVVVSDPDRMKLSCGLLTGSIIAGTNQVQSVVAERDVEIRILHPKGDRLARGDKAVYTADREEVVLTGEQQVEIALMDAEGLTRAQGTEIIYEGVADILRLVGNPKVTTAAGEVTGDTVVLDRARTTLKATGNWKMKLKADALSKPEKIPLPK